MYHRWFRRGSQIFFLFLSGYLFAQTRYGVPIILQNFLFRLDPLVFLVTSIALRTLLTAGTYSIILIILTLLFGRFFCGFVCPLGALIDFGDAVTRSVFVKQRLRWRPFFTCGKFLILLFLIAAALLQTSLLHFFDPVVIFYRTLTFFLTPVVTFILGSFTNIPVVAYTENIITIVIFLLIVGSGRLFTRCWCRGFCPLGGMLAVFAKVSLFKFSFKSECHDCSICERLCPTGAVDSARKSIDNGECIGCLRCIYECTQHSITYHWRLGALPFNMTRRKVFLALGSGIIAAPLARSLLHARLQDRLIRPPGAIPEQHFLNACIRCSMCYKICPTNGLQPCLLEAGVNGIWTPRLISRIGGCEKNCNRCGQICPTSVIRDLSLEEKTYVKMGTAVIHRPRCIAWEQNKICLICDEACPFNAIASFNENIRGTTSLRPFVDERVCTGCGLCEELCPIEGPAAIQIYAHGEERKLHGSYITAEKKRLRECADRPGDIPDGFITE